MPLAPTLPFAPPGMAAPGATGAPAEPAAAAATGMPDLSAMDPSHASAMFADPAFLQSAAKIFISHGLPEGLQWLERSHTAAKENVFGALQALEAGDSQAAIKAFNQSGRFTDATGAKQNDDGTWTLSRKGGKDVTIDPVAMRKSLLSPKDYFAQMVEDRKAKTGEQNAATMEGYRRDQADHMERMDQNKVEADQLRADAAADRTRMAGTVADTRAQAARDVNDAKASAASEKAALNNKYGPMALYNSILTKASENGDADAQKKADAALANHPDVEVKMGPNGQVGVFPEGGGKPYRTWANAQEFEQLTGRKLPQQAKAASATAATAPKSNEPGLVRRTLRGMGGGDNTIEGLDDSQLEQAASDSRIPAASADRARIELDQRKKRRLSGDVDRQPPAIY